MCLGIPAKVIQIDDSGQGKVDYLGTKVRTNFELLEANETLELLREYAEKIEYEP